MHVFKRKTRMVSFRVSEDEYLTIHRASESQSARSVSDYARDTLLHLLQDTSQAAAADALKRRVDELAAEFQALTHDLKNLRALVSHDPGSPKEVPCVPSS